MDNSNRLPKLRKGEAFDLAKWKYGVFDCWQ